MKIREISEQTSTDKPVKSKLGQMMAPTPVPKSLTQEPGKDSYARDLAGLLPGVGTALDVKDIAGGDYSSAPYMALGLLPGGGLLKKGAKKLRKFLGKADDVADAAPKANLTTAEKPKITVKPGESMPQAIERTAAERAAAEKVAADAAAAEKVAADAAAARKAAEQKELYKPKPLETKEQHLARIEREGGPEALAKYNQRLDILNKMPSTMLQKAGDKVVSIATYPIRHPWKTAGKAIVASPFLDTGYNYMQDPDAGVGTAVGKTGRDIWDFGKGVISGLSGKSPEELQKDVDAAAADSHIRAQSGNQTAPAPDAAPESPNQSKPDSAAVPDNQAPEKPKERVIPPVYQRQTPDDLSVAPKDKEKALTEKYLSYKAEAQTTKKELNYDELIRDPNVRIMLDLISRAEGNTDYDTIVGGGKFKDFSTHPNTTVKIKSRDKVISSDAAGRYQIMGFNWGPYSKRLGLKDFSPESQDKIAVAMLADRGALDSVLKGDFKSAVKKTGSQWTSLPSTDIIQGYGPKDWKWVNTQLSDIKKSYGQNDTDGTQVARVDKVGPVSEPKKDAKAEAKPGYYAVGDSQAQGVAGYGGEGWNKSMARTGASILDPKQFQAHLANIERIPRGSVVAISGGGNDINSAKPEVIVSQMNKLIAAAKARGLQVVHLLPTATDNPKTQQLRDQLRQAFLKGQTLVPIVDLGQASKKDPMNLHLDPKGYKVIAQNITNMLPLGSAVAGEVPTDGMGGPENKVAGNAQRVPTAAELAKINQRVKNSQDPVKELEKIIAQAAAAGQKTDALKKELDKLKQDYEKDKAKLAADEPGTVRIGPVKITAPSWLTGKDDKAADKPADKEQPQTYTITDKQGKLTTYARNEKGQWVSPSGKILSMPGDASSSMPSGFAGGSADAWDARLAAARGQKDKAVDNTAVDNKTASNKAADKTTQNQQSATGRVQPYVSPQGVKSDSDLSKPAKGVSTATAPPKSEKPADKTDTGAAEKAKKDAKKASAAAAEKAAAEKKNQQRAAVADVPDANATAKVNVRKEFERAFAAARAKQVQDTGKGSGGTFTWTDPRTGKEGTFTTDYGDEVKSKTRKAANVSVPDVSAPDITSQDTQELARRASQFKAEPNEIEKIIKDRLDKEVKSNSSVDVDPNASKVPPADSGNTDSLPPVIVTAKPDQANVLRSTNGTPVTSGTGEPWGTGTSTKDDLERAKAELQKKIDDEKAKKELQKISPDLSEPAAQDSFQDKWSRGIEWLTGKKIPDPKEMDKIRVPESVNTELKDILWLAGRTKK